MNKILLSGFLFLQLCGYTQPVNTGTYSNPILHADYSDPDAIRVGTDYYMVSSSFTHIPGLPILHSKDLVNWELIGHALTVQPPADYYSKVQHGAGVWAPSIRYHNNEFYIYYPDPDFGIYLVKAKNITGPWSEPVLVEAGKGLIDPCPLWDDNGKVYLAHAYAGSRAGFKSILVIKEMNKEGTKTITDPVLVFDGHAQDPTVEGPKLYKRNGYYYLFAPAGGVSTGWQLVLRSKNIYGPYERKVVMDQGKSPVNGPHQGAWVNTVTGEDWFLHFQDKDAYGRIVHLQAMKWVNDWPVIGADEDGDGKGEPVMTYKKPNVGKSYPVVSIPVSDEFNTPKLGVQWQWQANPQEGWAFATPEGYLQLFSALLPDSVKTAWDYPNILAQKLPAETFTATAKFSFQPRWEGEKFGMILHGSDYSFISMEKRKEGNVISTSQNIHADKGGKETVQDGQKAVKTDIYFRVTMSAGGRYRFSFSEDGTTFTSLGSEAVAKPGRWVGAKLGFFFTRINKTNDAGQVRIDWIRFTE
jgi:beta-xylosidase